MKTKNQMLRYLIVGLLAVATVLFMLNVSDSSVNFRNLELNSLQKDQMQYLGLQESEMREFLVKKEIYKGYLDTDKLSPHEVLGILAEDAATRRAYARSAARIRTKLIDSTRNFEALYLEEVSRLINPG